MRNLKRALSLALASVMLMGMMVVGTSAASYPDVDAADNLEAIEVLKAVGIMTGDEKGNFNPDSLVTRNEMAVVMVNLLGLKTGGTHPFTDVPSWANDYVAACYNNGIIAGTSATTFGGGADVTAVQAGLMVMKALGYFGYQGEFADDWKVATVKQANKIDLYDGINAYTDQSMSRNEVAQMVLNALECTIQVVTQEGGLSVDGNGITVVQNPTYKYADAENRSGRDYAGRGNTTTMELCEKIFGTDLKKNSDTTDDFGRPASSWTYGTSTITTPKTPELTYTKAVKGKAIYEDLGKVSGVNLARVGASTESVGGNTVQVRGYVVDNRPTDAGGLAITSNNNTEIGGKGTLTEVYFDKDTKIATVVLTNSYLAKADDDFDKDDEEVDVTIHNANISSATLSADDFAVSNVEKDDYLLVNLSYDGSNYVVKGVSRPTIVENAVVSAARAGDYVTAGGTKYEFNTVAKTASSGALGQNMMANAGFSINDDGYNLYLDASGYVVGVEGYDAGVNLDDYVFIKETSTNGFDDIAKALFADGTSKTITVDKVGGADSYTWTDAAIANKFYRFDTDKDGNYELTAVATSGTNVVKQGKADNSRIDNVAQPIRNSSNTSASVSLAGTSATVFIAKDRVYTGVKNAPEVKTASTVYYMTNEDGNLMLVYTDVKGATSSGADDLVYILNNNPAKAKDGDDTYYIYDAIVDGAKTTLDANDDNKIPGIYEIETYTDGRADLGTRISDKGVTNELVNVLGLVSSASYNDGTLVLGSDSFLLADGVKILTIDGNTVKSISAAGVKKAVADGFKYAAAIETSSSNSDIVVVYLSKTIFGGAPAAVITGQPSSVNTTVGSISESVSVTATYAGATSIAYQWYKDGASVTGATSSSYSLPGSLTAGVYKYTCEITTTKANYADTTITSDEAVVTVAPAAPTYSAGSVAGDVSDKTITITNNTNYEVGTYKLYQGTTLKGTLELATAGATLSFTGVEDLTTDATNFTITVTVNGVESAKSANISITPGA